MSSVSGGRTGDGQGIRLAVLADVHGNLPALEAVLEDVACLGVDNVIVAGDFTGGPQPQETVDLLRSVAGWIIRGNSEDYVLKYDAGQAPASWCTGPEWATFRWSFRRLLPGTLDFLAGLPGQCTVRLGGRDPIRIVHGSPNSPLEHVYPDQDPEVSELFRRADLLSPGRRQVSLSRVLAAVTEPVLVCAHSHIPFVWRTDQHLVVNPGAVSGSNNGDPRAQYALLTWMDGRWKVTLRAVAYELCRIKAIFRDTGFLQAGGVMASAFLLDILSAQNVPGRFAAHARRLAATAGISSEDPVSDEVWRQAAECFHWGELLPEEPELRRRAGGDQ